MGFRMYSIDSMLCPTDPKPNCPGKGVVRRTPKFSSW